MKRIVLLFFLCFCCLVVKSVNVDAFNEIDNHYWTTDPYQYPNNMTVVGIIEFNGNEQRTNLLEIGAFCGEDCRGSAVARYNDEMDRYFIFMMIYGVNGDSLNFRCYNHRSGMESEVVSQSYFYFYADETIGNVDNPFVFSFEIEQYNYNVTVDVMPQKEAGVIVGNGIYDEYDTCFIEITPNKGYEFEALLENGDTVTKQNNYSFIVLSDRHFVASFSKKSDYYKIKADASPIGAGEISGTGQYIKGEMCKLHVTPNSGYVYEGLYENDRLVTTASRYSFMPEDDHHFVAKFSPCYYNITAVANPEKAGTIVGAGKYYEGEICNLYVVADSSYVYEGLYEKGKLVTTDTMFSFVTNEDRYFEAKFSVRKKTYQITTEANPVDGGTIDGEGQYFEGETCVLRVVPNQAYIYKGLYENGKLVTYSTEFYFTINADRHFVAEFALPEYEVSLISNPEDGGTIDGGGIYVSGSMACITANPNEDYIFLKWMNEDGEEIAKDPQYVFEVTDDIILIADFVFIGKDKKKHHPLKIYPNPAKDYVVIGKDYCYGEVVVYNMLGNIVIKRSLGFKDDKIYVGNLSKGIYIITFYDDLKRYKQNKLVIH